jgi:hypothetical protein
MTITEPSTMITDYVLGAFTLWVAVAIARAGGGQVSRRFWVGALVFTGIAALAGGTSHGFRAMLTAQTNTVVWTLTLVSVGSATFCFLSATAWALLGPPWRRVVVTGAAVQWVVFVAWTAQHSEFRYAVYGYAPSMLLLLALYTVFYFRQRAASELWVIVGLVVSFAAAGVLAADLGFHTHFNANDVYHLVQMAGVYCFYRAGRVMVDRSV